MRRLEIGIDVACEGPSFQDAGLTLAGGPFSTPLIVIEPFAHVYAGSVYAGSD